MSAPWFILPGTCFIFSEHRLFLAHTRRSFASVQSRFETKPLWWFMYDTTDLLSERTSTWFHRMTGRKNWQAWHTASISRQLMCRVDSSSDHRLKVGLPSHSAPQPLLEVEICSFRGSADRRRMAAGDDRICELALQEVQSGCLRHFKGGSQRQWRDSEEGSLSLKRRNLSAVARVAEYIARCPSPFGGLRWAE